MISAATRRLERWIDRHFIGFTVTLLFFLFIFLYFARSIFITIPAGHGGALWLRFFGGTVMSFTYGEGTKIIFPWDKIYIYDLRVRQESEQVDVLTKEGLRIAVDVTLRFRLNPHSLGVITSYAGPDFTKTLVMPSVGATVRKVAADFTSEEIYSSRRHFIENKVLTELKQVLDDLIDDVNSTEPEIIVEDFWFRSIALPPNLQASIEAKLTQAQLAEQYVYILQREEREKERKIIEAQGIKSFQDIVSSGISENYLRWKGIDATLKLAESRNAKVVIVGGKEGLPVILGPLESSGGGQSLPLNSSPPADSGSAPGQQSGNPGVDAANRLVERPQLPLVPLALDPRISMPPPPLLPSAPDTGGR